ncbi:MAG: hypothetical protein R3Y36_09005 [Spirochaetales bacterium]
MICLCSPLCATEQIIEIEPYTQDNIPSWAKDIRRTSIITLGSLPFTTLTATLTYSLYRYIANDFDSAYMPNLFPTTSTAANITVDEQIGIISTAFGISVLIGLADFIFIKVSEKQTEETHMQDDRIIIEVVKVVENEIIDTEAEKESDNK